MVDEYPQLVGRVLIDYAELALSGEAIDGVLDVRRQCSKR
jgi:hypothetical protein